MELSGGEVAAKRAPSATGEDRISALPDELLLLILLFLSNAADAARTSVLSRRWRTVWTLLPDLRVPFFPEPLSFLRALGASQLHLRYLKLEGDGATPESLEIWLPAAARRLSGTLVLVNHVPDPDVIVLVNHAPDPEPEPDVIVMPPMKSSRRKWKKMKKDWFEMPCFETAARIFLDLGFLRAIVPFAGVFARLTVLVLERVWFYSPCELGDAVSWPRCPRLQVLKVCHARGLRRLAINSESLLELELSMVRGLQELTVEAAALMAISVEGCFPYLPIELLVATISAPRLVVLKWSDMCGQRCLELGQMPHLQYIGDLSYFVYGNQGPNGGIAHNLACMELLQCFKAIKILSLTLAYAPEELSNYEYVMEDMKVLPDHEVLYLTVLANGHSFGASSFHVLRMCLGIKRLVLVLLDNVKAEAKTPCLPGCVCDDQPNWKTEELLLINLKEIEIQLLRGSEHEVSFVKRLLNWATTLNKMTVTLSSSTTESNAKELLQMFKSLSKPEVCMKLMNHNHKKVLYAT